MAGPFNIAIKAVLKQLGKGSARAVPKDIMSGTIRRIKQEASLPETPRRVLGKELDEYTGPHSDFKRKEGLESIEEVDVKSFQDKYFRGDDKTRYRSKDLEKKTRELDEGLITLDDFKKARDEIKPLKTYGTVPPLNKQVDEAGELIAPNKFDPIEIVGPIGKTRVDKSGIIGFNKFIKEGERSTSRFDIDAYNHYDRYIPVIETLVDKVSKATGKITKRFAKKGYSPTAVLTDVNFNYNPKKAFSIAKGETKAPFATMEGNWKNLTPEEAHRYAKEKVGTEGWTEVGFDPAARQSFYNRATGEPVFKADEVIQVGAMVLARGLKKATPKQLEKLKITTKAGKEITYKHGGKIMAGGLSGIKKSININGQPHSLAWINPDEASALKAMGGSGKKGPMGIPSYQTTDEDYSWDWGDTGGYDYGAGKTEADIAADPGRDVSVYGETGYSDEALRDYAAGLGTTVRGLGPIGTERAKAEQLTDMRKGFLGRYGDRMTRGELEQSVYNRAFNDWFSNPDNRRQENAVDKFHSMFQKGMRGGGAENILTSSNPLGELYKQNERMIETALKARQERNLAKIELFDASDEEFAQHKKEALLDAAKNIVDDFQPYKGTGVAKALSYLEPIALKGIRGAMGLISDTEVIGTGTVNGQGVHVHSDGSITYVSPESAPDYDWTGREGGVDDEILDRRKLPRRPIAAAPVEKPKTGMAAYYERLGQERSPTTRIASNKYLEELLASIYPTNRPTLG